MSISQKQIESVIMLPAPKRYSHFVKKVVGWRKVWALYNDGWAMSESNEGEKILPLWPEKEYAELCIAGDWSGYLPRSIDLNEVLDSLIPTLRERNVLPGVFFTVDDGSVNASVDELERDIRAELSKYE